MAPSGKLRLWLTASMLCASANPGAQAQTEAGKVDNFQQVFARLKTCWKPPPPSRASPDMEITAIVSFTRDGNILGRPKITYESEQASNNDRLEYRIAVMETLQRCTPMPFTEGMGGAVAGHPFAIRFQTRKRPPPTEKRAWLTTTIL